MAGKSKSGCSRRQLIDVLDGFDKNGDADKVRQENHNSIIEDLVKNRGELDSIRKD